MEPLLVSTGVVAIAEIGDKTQLLAIVLAARFRRPMPIILGILAGLLVAAQRDGGSPRPFPATPLISVRFGQ